MNWPVDSDKQGKCVLPLRPLDSGPVWIQLSFKAGEGRLIARGGNEGFNDNT
ncbi:hypothetical protein [Novosphingobium sp. ZW T3_23]|uniref:hypothetical protein n=1 Tax=Novosphingobium sp. ZW T3_23 TaxID=3378084 RepID=UPI003854D67A